MPTKIVIPYQPRAAFLPFHNRKKRWACLVCHRRAGKTVACVNELIKAALTEGKKDGRYAYIAPQLSQAKDIAWSYIKQFTGALPGVQYNESELWCQLPGGNRIRLYGTDNADRLRGLYMDGAIMDEYAQHDPTVFDLIIRPQLIDRNGWAVFIGTPAGHNKFYEVHQKSLGIWENDDGSRFDNSEWFSMTLRASESGILPLAELEAARREMSADAYDQELECSFEAAIKGAVFGREMKDAQDQGRICGVPYDRSSEVWTAWDLGIGDATAIWFAQQVGREVRIIDFYMASGVEIGHYVKILREKPYLYARHLLPHDADKTELGTGMSIVEQLKSIGVRNTRIVPKLTVAEGLEQARKFMGRCYFDQKMCYQGLEALKIYRYEYSEKLGVFAKRPLHDWASHPADAFRYLAIGFKPESLNAAPIIYPNLAIP
jgi:hypothetical protein